MSPGRGTELGDRIRDALRRGEYAEAARIAADPGTVGSRLAEILDREPDDEPGPPGDLENAPPSAP
jgi:hypothetical protein